MKKLLIVIVTASGIAVTSLASADQRVTVQQAPITEIRNQNQAYRLAPRSYSQPRRPRPASNENLFDRLMELERRKNQWLRRTFLGR